MDFGAMMGLGVILFGIAYGSTIILAFTTSFRWGIGCFIWPVSLLFSTVKGGAAKKLALLQLIGIAMMFIGKIGA